MRQLRFKLAVAVCVFAAALGGCRKSPPQSALPANPEGVRVINPWGIPVVEPGTGVLKGKVTCDGKSIKAGHILFCYERGLLQAPGAIAPDGTYVTKQLHEGPATLCLVLDPGGKLPFPEQPGGEPGLQGPGLPAAGPAGRGQPGRAAAPGRPGSPGGLPVGRPAAGLPPSPGGHAPPGLPPLYARMLRRFRVPKGEEELYARLHAKYCKAAGSSLRVVIGPGETTFNIALTP